MIARPAVWLLRRSGLRTRQIEEVNIHTGHLALFRGTLQADGYAGFNRLYEGGHIREAACWAHVSPQVL